MHIHVLSFWRVALSLSMAGLIAFQASAHDPGENGEADHVDLPALDLPQPSPEALSATKKDYLAPLEALLSDETAFVSAVEGMGDEEVLQVDGLKYELHFGQPTADEALKMQMELQERLRKLDWLCETALSHFSENAAVRNFRGNVFYDSFGKQIEGVKEWHLAVSLDSAYADPYNNLGMHYFHVGRYPLGFQNMDKALDLEPNNPDYCFNMAQNYLIFGPQVKDFRNWDSKRVYKEAMKLSKRAVKNAPDDYQLLEDYAVNFLAAQNFGVTADWKDAARAWQAAREHAPNQTKVFYTWLNEGRVWKYMERSKEARRCLEEAIKIIPDSDVAVRLLDGLDEEA